MSKLNQFHASLMAPYSIDKVGLEKHLSIAKGLQELHTTAELWCNILKLTDNEQVRNILVNAIASETTTPVVFKTPTGHYFYYWAMFDGENHHDLVGIVYDPNTVEMTLVQTDRYIPYILGMDLNELELQPIERLELLRKLDILYKKETPWFADMQVISKSVVLLEEQSNAN